MPSAEPLESAEMFAVVHCVECGRPWQGGEDWHLHFADIAEVAVYCPECDTREFERD